MRLVEIELQDPTPVKKSTDDLVPRLDLVGRDRSCTVVTEVTELEETTEMG